MAGNTGRSGGQFGNRNSAKGQLWSDAVRKAVNAKDPISGKKQLNRIATKVVEMALHGDIHAIHEIGNRLDGKPHQSVAVEGEFTHELTKIECVIVDPGAIKQIENDDSDVDVIDVAPEDLMPISSEPHDSSEDLTDTSS